MKEYLRCAPSLPEYITCAPKPSLPKDKIKCEYCNKIVLGLELHQSYNKKCKQQQDLVNARRAQEQAEQALVEEENWFVARDNMAPPARFVRPLEERKPANPNPCLSQKVKCEYCNKVCMTPDGLKQHQKFSKRCKLQESRQPRHCPNDYPDWWRQLIASEGTYREVTYSTAFQPSYRGPGFQPRMKQLRLPAKQPSIQLLVERRADTGKLDGRNRGLLYLRT